MPLVNRVVTGDSIDDAETGSNLVVPVTVTVVLLPVPVTVPV